MCNGCNLLTVHLSLNYWWVADSWVGLHAFDAVFCCWLLGLISVVFIFSPRLNGPKPGLDGRPEQAAVRGQPTATDEGIRWVGSENGVLGELWTRESHGLVFQVTRAADVPYQDPANGVLWRQRLPEKRLCLEDLTFLGAWCKSLIKLLERQACLLSLCRCFTPLKASAVMDFSCVMGDN